MGGKDEVFEMSENPLDLSSVGRCRVCSGKGEIYISTRKENVKEVSTDQHFSTQGEGAYGSIMTRWSRARLFHQA